MSFGDGKSNMNNNNIYNSNVNRQPFSFGSPSDPNTLIRHPGYNSQFLRKRSVAEFEQFRNVRSRPNGYQFNHASHSLSPVDLSMVNLTNFTNSQYGLPMPNNSLYSFQNPVQNVVSPMPSDSLYSFQNPVPDVVSPMPSDSLYSFQNPVQNAVSPMPSNSQYSFQNPVQTVVSPMPSNSQNSFQNLVQNVASPMPDNSQYSFQNPVQDVVSLMPSNSQYSFQNPVPDVVSPMPSNSRNSFQNLVQNVALPMPDNSQYSFQNPVPDVVSPTIQTGKEMMDEYFRELEEELLRDFDDDEGSQTVSIKASNSELIPTTNWMINPIVSPTPASTSSSYSPLCSSTSAYTQPIDLKQSLVDAAVAISDGQREIASGILMRLQQLANASGDPEQRLASYMIPALSSRLNCARPVAVELWSKEHRASTQLLYDVSMCFKLGFMAANLIIIGETVQQGFQKIHIVDFEIGRGRQYVNLLHSMAAAMKGTENKAVALKISTLAGGSTSSHDKEMEAVGASLKALAQQLNVSFDLVVRNFSIGDLSREILQVQHDEALVFNFAFHLYKLPDESVTMENQRDQLLRRVKTLSPTLVTVVEREINTNTAPLAARVREAFDYYGALFESLDATIGRDNSDRLKIEGGLGRKLANSIACEGKDRIERCEVFGKWRARISMAGFEQRHVSQLAAEWLKSKLESGTCGNPGFTVEERFGAFCFGWMGRTINFTSAWH